MYGRQSEVLSQIDIVIHCLFSNILMYKIRILFRNIFPGYGNMKVFVTTCVDRICTDWGHNGNNGHNGRECSFGSPTTSHLHNKHFSIQLWVARCGASTVGVICDNPYRSKYYSDPEYHLDIYLCNQCSTFLHQNHTYFIASTATQSKDPMVLRCKRYLN